jgi:uncharacterized membrane protein
LPAEVRLALTRFEGPLPPPDILARYYQIDPEVGKWILDTGKAEQNHRHREERWRFALLMTLLHLGLVVAGVMILALAALGAIIAIYAPDAWVRLAGAAGTIATMIAAVATALHEWWKRRAGPRPENENPR